MESNNRNLCPRIATVTYLGDQGAPTIVLDCRCPSSPEESARSRIQQAWVSHPSRGKQISFDGRLLHGSPGQLARRLEGQPKHQGGKASWQRITFLVNCWLDHRPETAQPLPDASAATMAPALRQSPLKVTEGGDKLESKRIEKEHQLVRHKWPISQEVEQCHLLIGLPSEPPSASFSFAPGAEGSVV